MIMSLPTILLQVLLRSGCFWNPTARLRSYSLQVESPFVQIGLPDENVDTNDFSRYEAWESINERPTNEQTPRTKTLSSFPMVSWLQPRDSSRCSVFKHSCVLFIRFSTQIQFSFSITYRISHSWIASAKSVWSTKAVLHPSEPCIQTQPVRVNRSATSNNLIHSDRWHSTSSFSEVTKLCRSTFSIVSDSDVRHRSQFRRCKRSLETVINKSKYQNRRKLLQLHLLHIVPPSGHFQVIPCIARQLFLFHFYS